MVGATGKDPSTRPADLRSHDSVGEGLAPPAGAAPTFVLRRRGDLWSPAVPQPRPLPCGRGFLHCRTCAFAEAVVK